MTDLTTPAELSSRDPLYYFAFRYPYMIGAVYALYMSQGVDRQGTWAQVQKTSPLGGGWSRRKEI